MATCSGTRNNEDAVLECVQALADKNVDVNAFDRLVLRIWNRSNTLLFQLNKCEKDAGYSFGLRKLQSRYCIFL